MSMHNQIMDEINNKREIEHNDYMYVWNNYVNYNNGDIENFGETDLEPVLKCLNKANFIPSSLIFASSWEKSILLDKDFINFVRKYEEKILFRASNLTGDIKRKEHISLIFMSACNIGTQVSMFALNEDENKYKTDELYTSLDIYRLFQGQIVEFLSDINKGTANQQLQCLLSIDNLLDEYPEQRIGLSKLCGLKESSKFIDIVMKSLSETPDDELEHIEGLIYNFKRYVNAKELEKELAHKNEPNSIIKKIKV